MAKRVTGRRLDHHNRRALERRTDALHCALTEDAAWRAVLAQAEGLMTWSRDVTPALIREAYSVVTARHRQNRANYRHVMGHEPLPDKRLIRAVMMGDLSREDVGC